MRKKEKLFGPITTIMIILIVVMVVTSILSLLGFEGQEAIITNGKLETHLVTVNNIFSLDGIKYLFQNTFSNFQNYQPLFFLIISLITIGIMEKSGLIRLLSTKVKKLKFKYLTLLVLLVSIISIYIGDYSYALLIPLSAVIYKKIGKNPILGILTVFSGISLSYGISFIYNTYTLGLLTQASARVDVDANYTFNILSTIYIAIFTAIVLVLLCSDIIEKRIAPKFNNPTVEEDEIIVSKEASQYVGITLLSLLAILIYFIIPSPYSGYLLDNNETNYIAKLFSANSPFGQGLPYILLLIIMACSFVYGKVSKNIKSSIEYNEGLSEAFEETGYIFVLMFFISQLIGLVNWTNIGTVISANILDLMSRLEFSGLPLIIITFIFIIFITILIPSTIDKWLMFSPIIIPLFMRSNITPEFTQFMFGLADGIGKMLTPIFPYYVIVLGFLYKYRNKNNLTLFNTIKTLLPVTLITAGIFLLIIISWFLIGLPVGINILPSL